MPTIWVKSHRYCFGCSLVYSRRFSRFGLIFEFFTFKTEKSVVLGSVSEDIREQKFRSKKSFLFVHLCIPEDLMYFLLEIINEANEQYYNSGEFMQ